MFVLAQMWLEISQFYSKNFCLARRLTGICLFLPKYMYSGSKMIGSHSCVRARRLFCFKNDQRQLICVRKMLFCFKNDRKLFMCAWKASILIQKWPEAVDLCTKNAFLVKKWSKINCFYQKNAYFNSNIVISHLFLQRTPVLVQI
jgi:hypothetical protein